MCALNCNVLYVRYCIQIIRQTNANGSLVEEVNMPFFDTFIFLKYRYLCLSLFKKKIGISNNKEFKGPFKFYSDISGKEFILHNSFYLMLLSSKLYRVCYSYIKMKQRPKPTYRKFI